MVNKHFILTYPGCPAYRVKVLDQQFPTVHFWAIVGMLNRE